MKINTPRIMFVGTGSGCGKTTITCAVLKAMIEKGYKVTSFKSGPDYIDPMFHTKTLNINSANLDLFLLNENTAKHLFYTNSKNSDLAVVEGAMGMYDGKGFDNDTYSANHLSKILEIPEILVVNIKGKSVSALAEIYGYLNFASNNIKGVILNNCKKTMYPYYKQMIENNLGIKVLGFMPNIKQAEIGSRHLGLITADEIKNIEVKLQVLGNQATESVDIDEIMNIAKSAKPVDFEYINIQKVTQKKPLIAVAMDKAFCFYYKDSLKLLEEMGAELSYFSPVKDNALPQNTSGIFLGGGYPEVYVEELSENISMKNSIKNAIEQGMPTFAECGGFMYLGKSIISDGTEYPLCGVVDSNFFMTDNLVRFGYSVLKSKSYNFLLDKDEEVACHEFHYSDGTFCGNNLISQKSRVKKYDCGICEKNLFALYPHIHFYSNLNMAKRFVKACEKYISERS